MKGWQILLIILAGMFVVGGLLSVADEHSIEEPATTETEQSVPVQEEAEEIDDYTAPVKERKPVVEIYDEVELGMEEGEVWGIAGKPEITSQTEDPELGTVLQLIYSDGHSLDNVTIMFDDGRVALIVLGEFDGSDIAVKSKM